MINLICSGTIIYRAATYQIITNPTNSITTNATHSTADYVLPIDTEKVKVQK